MILTSSYQEFNFADDKQVAVIIKSSEDTHKLQSAIDHLMDWCDKNELLLNKAKYKSITFTHKRNPIGTNYTMSNHLIDLVNVLRYLGVKTDMKLTFIPHIEYIISKAKAVLAFVKRQSHFLDRDAIFIIYMALVRSIVAFAAPI